MTPRVTLMMGAMCACAAAQKAVQRVPADARQIVAAPARAERDRSMDPQRKPVQMLEFFGTAPGMRVADLGAGGGYSTELWARSRSARSGAATICRASAGTRCTAF